MIIGLALERGRPNALPDVECGGREDLNNNLPDIELTTSRWLSERLWAANKARRLGYCMASENKALRDGVLEVFADRSTDAEGICLT